MTFSPDTTSVSVSWLAVADPSPSTPVLSYTLFYAKNSSTSLEQIYVGTDLEFNFTGGFAAGFVYKFTVTATNSVGSSAQSDLAFLKFVGK